MPSASSLIVAALVVAAIALLALALRAPPREGFLGGFQYSPACRADWTGRRRTDCRGYTAGEMPAIEVAPRYTRGLCCGRLGAPC